MEGVHVPQGLNVRRSENRPEEATIYTGLRKLQGTANVNLSFSSEVKKRKKKFPRVDYRAWVQLDLVRQGGLGISESLTQCFKKCLKTHSE